MNIEEQLKRYRENQNIIPDEQHIKETVRKSIESYCSVEQEKQLTYWVAAQQPAIYPYRADRASLILAA